MMTAWNRYQSGTEQTWTNRYNGLNKWTSCKLASTNLNSSIDKSFGNNTVLKFVLRLMIGIDGWNELLTIITIFENVNEQSSSSFLCYLLHHTLLSDVKDSLPVVVFI